MKTKEESISKNMDKEQRRWFKTLIDWLEEDRKLSAPEKCYHYGIAFFTQIRSFFKK